MQTSGYYVQNKYGAFGYAVGQTRSGDTCFYGWQRITSTGFTQTWIGNKGSIQVRLRLCDQNASRSECLGGTPAPGDVRLHDQRLLQG
jgi:hypothetical protein